MGLLQTVKNGCELIGFCGQKAKLTTNNLFDKNRGNKKSWLAIQLSRVVSAFLFLGMCTSLYAEGTKTWQPDGSVQSNLYVTSPTSNTSGVRSFAGYLSQPNMKMYIHIKDPDNEIVYLGFSQGSSRGVVSGYNFRIVSPSGAIVHGPFTVNTPNITNYNMAVAGPDVLAGGGYPTATAMFVFDPQGLTSGDYSIEFGNDVSMEWFDVTLATKGASAQEIQGRLWSQAWQVDNGSFTADLKAMFFARDDRGYVTQVNFAEAGIRPFVGQFSFNDTGTGDTGNPAQDRKSVPNAQSGNPEHQIFLNQPDPNVYPLGLDGQIQNLPLKIDDPANPNVSIEVTQSGRVEVVLDFGTIGDYSETVDVRLFADLTAGLNTIPWNGKKGDGLVVQPEDYPIPVTISYTQGETHFTAYDVEYLNESFVVRTQTTAGLTSPNVLFWDDSNIAQNPDIPPNVKVNTDVGSVARQPWSNFDYGNVNTINTWWFAYRDYVSTTVLLPGDYGDAPVSYGGVVHKVIDTPTVYLGAIAPDKELQMPATLDGTGDDVVATDDEDALATIPDLWITDTSYSLNVVCAGTATVAGWIDFNRDNAFDSNERTSANCVSNSATLSWTGLSSLVIGQSYIRLRIASNAADIVNPSGGASDGEVEDYPLTIRENRVTGTVKNSDNTPLEAVTVSIKNNAGAVVNDANGQPLTITTNVDGNYSFAGIPPGDYDIVMVNPVGYIALSDTDSSADGDVNPNISTTDGKIPLSISKEKEDSDNNFIVATASQNAITQCSAGTLGDNLIEFKLGNIDTEGFVSIGDTRDYLNVARIAGVQVDAKVTVLDIQGLDPAATLELLNGGELRVSPGITDHQAEHLARVKIDFVDNATGNPVFYNFAIQTADIDGAAGQPQEFVRYYAGYAETMVANPTNLTEASTANYIEFRGTATQNGEANSAASAFYTNASSVTLSVGQRDTLGSSGFILDFQSSRFVLPFCNGYDFGDAEGYNTTGLTAAKHGVVNDLFMGANVDIDSGTQEDSAALADDENGIADAATQDDENGINSFDELNDLNTTYSLSVSVTNNTGTNAKLMGWIDVDGNDVFDADEASSITTVTSGANGSNVNLNWNAVPADILAHQSYLRIRLTTDSLSASDSAGTKLDGEVEDYVLTIEVGGFPVKGRIYNDSNVDGVNDSGEAGVSGLPVVLLDIANSTCVSTTTDADGNYIFFPVIPGNYRLYEASRETVSTPQACDVAGAKDPAGYRSTTTNALPLFSVVDAEITGKDFGDVKAPLFTPDHSGTVPPSNVIYYAHKFTPKSTGVVTFVSNNSGGVTTGWSNVLYQDADCNGKLEGAEANAPIATNLPTTAGQNICLINKAFAPATVSVGETFTNVINADFDFDPSDTTLAGSILLKVTDITKAANDPIQGSSKLELVKKVENITQGTGVTETQNLAKPGDVLKYYIYYSNTGTGPITDLKINDSVPDFTTLNGSPVCQTPLPVSLTSCVGNVTGSDIEWTFGANDVLDGGGQGEVSYEVTID